jgi:hypothetical protein
MQPEEATMIELTHEQQRAAAQGEPVRLVDATTRDAYILVRADVFARLTDVLPAPEHKPPAEIGPQRLRSMQAFWRDLPELLKTRRNHGRWVAYRENERVGFGKTQAELYQDCFRRGLQRGEFYIGRIKASDVPPWGTVQADWSLYEVTNVGEGVDPGEAV